MCWLVILTFFWGGCHKIWPYVIYAVENTSNDASGAIDGKLNDGHPLSTESGQKNILDGNKDSNDAQIIPNCLLRYPHAICCDDFESPQLSSLWSEVLQNPTAPLVSGPENGKPAFAGKGSLRVRLTELGAVDGGALIVKRFSPAITSGDSYLRSYLYIPNTSNVLTNGYFSLMGLRNQDGSQSISLEVYFNSTEGFRFGLHRIVTSTYSGMIPGNVPLSTWICLELHIKVADTGGGSVSINEQVVTTALNGQDTLPDAGFNMVSFGGFLYGQKPATPIEYFLDEVVLSSEPIGCIAKK